MVESVALSGIERRGVSGELNLGSCCACHGTENVRNVVMHDKRGPVPGTGWGCVVCDLPADGAISVICDSCLESKAKIVEVIDGYASSNLRVPIESLSAEPFQHDTRKHEMEVA